MFECIWGVFVASNLHVEIGKNNQEYQNIFGFSQFGGVFVPARRENTVWKNVCENGMEIAGRAAVDERNADWSRPWSNAHSAKQALAK